jgi:uncharacterized membrane protein YccC
MTPRTIIAQFGFDASRLIFTLRTSAATCCALCISWLVGLEHPQWSSMTVWIASQPVRGHLLEKSVFRAVGTVTGSLFGIGLLAVSEGRLWVIIVGLALWIGLCTVAGTILRGFASYGANLAGYSAAMVALLHSARSDGPFMVGVDRMLTVLLGLLVALAIGWAFAAPDNLTDVARRVRRLSGRILGDLAARLAGAEQSALNEHYLLLSEMAAIEDELDGHAAGSFRSRNLVQAIRQRLTAQVALVLWMQRQQRAVESALFITALKEAAEACGQLCGAQTADAALRQAAKLSGFDPVLREALVDLAAAIEDKPHDVGRMSHTVAVHRDWIGAREAFLRAAIVVLASGAIWLATGWEAGPLMLLGAAIMTTLFSTADNPTMTLRQAFVGQVAGVMGASICRWLIWPLANGETWLVVSMIPFIIAGSFLMAHRHTASVGFDYNMAVLLLLQPAWPLSGSFTHFLTAGAAVLLGPAIGLLAFLSIFPVDGERRLRTLVEMMVREIEAMASRRDVSQHRSVWRARLHHRVLRLVRWADKNGAGREEVIEASLAVLLSGSAVVHIDEVLRKPELERGTMRPLKLAQARLRNLGSDPRRAARALAAAARLCPGSCVDANLLQEAAAKLSNSANLIQQIGTFRKVQALAA